MIDRPYIKRISILGGEPLAEENFDGVLDLVTEINKRYNRNVFQNAGMLLDRGRGSLPSDLSVNDKLFSNESRLSRLNKSIWIYSGFYWEEIFEPSFTNQIQEQVNKYLKQCEIRKQIISQCDVLIDGRYVDSEKDISLPYRGSKNQSIIDIQKSLQKGEIVLWQT